MILAIDPGPTESAFVMLDDNLKPCQFDKGDNAKMLRIVKSYSNENICDHFAMEMVASYGMAVGKEVFETCVWIGRFWERSQAPYKQFIYRKDEKMNLCHNMRAKDSNIRQALIDRFAKHDLKNGKGTIKNPDWFHGFSKDVWQAYAVGVTYYDLYLKEGYANENMQRMQTRKNA